MDKEEKGPIAESMGDKINSKLIAKNAGCFVIPGFEGEVSNEDETNETEPEIEEQTEDQVDEEEIEDPDVEEDEDVDEDETDTEDDEDSKDKEVLSENALVEVKVGDANGALFLRQVVDRLVTHGDVKVVQKL